MIRERAGFHPELGITLDALEGVLNELHPGALYSAGAVWPEELPRLDCVVPFIALLRTPSRHIVIVDEIAEGEVTIRDPWGLLGCSFDASEAAPAAIPGDLGAGAPHTLPPHRR